MLWREKCPLPAAGKPVDWGEKPVFRKLNAV
jgi:hypothetical protein